MDPLEQLAADVGARLLAKDQRLATAESCTGGLIAATCTAVAGSSEWFEAGFVTYRLTAKEQLLGIPHDLLDRYGAVSEPVASAMAQAALERSQATVAVSVTGLAGPTGGEVDHPVGTVWFAWAMRDAGEPLLVQASLHELAGDRSAVRRAAVELALTGVIRTLGG